MDFIEKKLDKELSNYKLVAIDIPNLIATVDLYNPDGTLKKKNEYINVSHLVNTVKQTKSVGMKKIPDEIIPDGTWGRKSIREWLDKKELKYFKYFPFKFLLLMHVKNYQIIIKRYI